MAGRRRDQRRILEASLIASVLSGAPSTSWMLARRGPAAAARSGVEATRAIGVLVPEAGHPTRPGRPGVIRGVAGHLAVSLLVGEALGSVLPRRRAVAAGAVAGLAIGAINLMVIAPRWFPEIAALDLGPQLADNAAFGAIFAAIADR
jgi:hypothetical protein